MTSIGFTLPALTAGNIDDINEKNRVRTEIKKSSQNEISA